jgi:hypothetical protein
MLKVELNSYYFHHSAINIGPPKIISAPNGSGFGFGSSGGMGQERKRLPNMELIASINATLAKKSGDNPQTNFPFGSAAGSVHDDSAEASRKRKRKSRWGAEDVTEKIFIPGMPTVLPANLSKEQEEAYLRKSLSSFYQKYFFRRFKVLVNDQITDYNVNNIILNIHVLIVFPICAHMFK